MIASSAPNSGSNTAPLASKQAAKVMLSSNPKNPAIRRSSWRWMSCVPQINRTEAMPKPWLLLYSDDAAINSG